MGAAIWFAPIFFSAKTTFFLHRYLSLTINCPFTGKIYSTKTYYFTPIMRDKLVFYSSL